MANSDPRSAGQRNGGDRTVPSAREITSPLDELLIREAVQLGFNSRSNFVRSNRGSLKVCVDTYLTGRLPMPVHAKEFIVPCPQYQLIIQRSNLR